MGLLESGRTHTCGELKAAHVGQDVRLMGWVHNRRDHGGAIFVDLRDRYGLTQVVFRPDVDAATHELAADLRAEHCIAVGGQVISRGENINPKLPTGEIEVSGTVLEVFSRAQTPPFPIDGEVEAREAIRLKHRYLDLRRPTLQQNFVTRAKVCRVVREHLDEQGFLELETPFLIKNTPGGARNFLVPSRLNRHSFYALAESPQLFKQLFMVAGFDRYYQIVRCFRDEDLRGDRQPEFTQVDIELSFPREELVLQLIEGLIADVFDRVLGQSLPRPFPRLTYAEAMARYGSDKPDLRYALPLTDVTDLAPGCGFRIFEQAVEQRGIVKALRLPTAASALSRKDLDALPELVKPVGARGVAYARVQEDGSWQAPFAKVLQGGVRDAIAERCGLQAGDVLLFVADQASVTHNALSLLRGHMAQRFGLIDLTRRAPLWVTEFPLFQKSDDSNDWVACHHPFTAPHPDDVELIDGPDRGRARARAYDLVLDGVEIAGGSIRIYDEALQARVFRAIGISPEEAEAKFSFLLEAFRYGPPPHGGIAIGLDRLVMLMCGAESLRDVVAFPKTQKGTCLMTGAPSLVNDRQLDELHILRKP